MNTATIIGNLTGEPQMRYTDKGTALATFTVATDESYVKDGQRIERTEFVPCQAWRRMAEKVGGYSKGQPVCVVGPVTTQSWEKNGKKYYKTQVTAQFVTTIAASGETKRRTEPKPKPTEPETPSDDDDPDVPF